MRTLEFRSEIVVTQVSKHWAKWLLCCGQKLPYSCFLYRLRVYFPLTFQWDRDKNELNIQKHGIDFEDATDVFFDFHIVIATKTNHTEMKELAIGMSHDREVTIIYTWRGVDIRIISARRARINERELFYVNRAKR